MTVANAFETTRSLAGLHRHAHDQWLRAAQSIPLNIVESHGKRSLKNRARFLDIARGSALKRCDSGRAGCFWMSESGNEFRSEIQTGANCGDVGKDGTEIR
jgi:23S rRNA-intervening sequence protein